MYKPTKYKVTIFCLLLLFAGSDLSAQKSRAAITGIVQACFYTKDLKANNNFYKNYLGFTDIHKLNKQVLNDTAYIFINAAQRVALIPQKSIGGNRLHHFAVSTDNAESLRKYLAKKNILVPPKITKDASGNLSFFVTDPNGTICEIIQTGKKKSVNKNSGNLNTQPAIANRMSHVGFMVADVDKAISFYVDILGFKEIWRGSKDGKNVTWVNLQVPDGKDYIELMLYNKEQSDENMGVLNHICLEVDDVMVSAATLANKTLPQGCKQTTAIKTGINKKRQINCFDIDGTRVEIMEAKTIDGQPAASSTAAPLKFISQ